MTVLGIVGRALLMALALGAAGRSTSQATPHGSWIEAADPAQNWPGLSYLGTNRQGHGEYRNTKDGSILVHVPAGAFILGEDNGSPESGPKRTLMLDDCLIGKFEVTVRQYARFLLDSGRRLPSPFLVWPLAPDLPVVGLNWFDAVAYCEWAEGRLPSELEWEKAARGTDGRRFPWGDTEVDASRAEIRSLNSRTRPWDPLDPRTHLRVAGLFPAGASPYGVEDVADNAAEWTSTVWRSDLYRVLWRVGVSGPSEGERRVFRGGQFASSSEGLRVALRNSALPCQYSWAPVGIRLARSAPWKDGRPGKGTSWRQQEAAMCAGDEERLIRRRKEVEAKGKMVDLRTLIAQ